MRLFRLAAPWLAALALVAGPAPAQVLVQLTDEPLDLESLAAGNDAPDDALRLDPARRRAVVPGSRWIVPHFRVDKSSPTADSTLWSVRHEGDTEPIGVQVIYRDVGFQQQALLELTLFSDEVRSFNLQSVLGLAVAGDGIARGLVDILATGPVSVDTFQVDFSEDFATGGPAVPFPEGFCTFWQARFLSFEPGESSVLTFLVNGPLGGGAGDPATVQGNVFDEDGDFLNAFSLRTDDWSFEVAILDFVAGGVAFGSVELVLETSLAPRGTVSVSHRARGRLSVGHSAVCRDGP